VAAPVRLQFDTLEEPQDGFTGNLSTGGMFVQGRNPRSVGTLLRFELQLGEGEPIRGVGEVVWIRAHSLGPEAPSGMGVQFGHLDDSNRDRLRAVVFEALESLGVEGLTEPAPQGPDKRPQPRQGPEYRSDPAPSPEQPDTRKTRTRAKSPPAKPTGGKVSRQAKSDKKGGQPPMTGKTKGLLVILGLLVLLFLFVL
jgi:uncharacterized protein (TIGR02266 family)